MDADVCIHCSAVGCLAGVADHTPDCPFTTDVWPVTAHDLDSGMACAGCHTTFEPGDHYTLNGYHGAELVICLGCDALHFAGRP
jgi:hypothetical protein